MPTILCISHLEWTRHLFQRPQQVMLRLSKSYKVVYLKVWWSKEWMHLKKHYRKLRSFRVNDNLTVFNVLMPLPTLAGRLKLFKQFNEWHLLYSLKRHLSIDTAEDVILWYYCPMHLDLIEKINSSSIIYECMDNHIALANRNRSTIDYIRHNEPYLLSKADVIFYGSSFFMKSRKEYEYKSYHVPTGVDVDFFRQAMNPDIRVPDDIRKIKGPIIGYWGAVDERIDYDLLNECATQRPDWSIVLLGPMVKITKEQIDFFLKLPNVHWLGPKRYELLPGYAKAFDVCILPFKESDVGKYLNPTKTLEYLATGKPVVSTKIPDMVEFYSDTVDIAAGKGQFIESVEKRIGADDHRAKKKRLARAREWSWEKMVAKMEGIVREEIGKVHEDRC